MKPRNWFRFQNAADPTVAEIHIVDIIGDWIDELINEYWGVKATLTAKAFLDQLAKLDASVTTIRVHINSPGGDVFAALNIANALRDQQTSKGRTVETVIDGLAASAASIIAMAGKTVTIADNALVMVHNPWTIGVGNASAMRKTADDLDVIRDTIVATYLWHASIPVDQIKALMDAETWMDADQAIANGFATAKIEGLQAAASIDRRAIATLKVPEQFRARVESLLQPETPAPAAAADVLAAVEAAGLGTAFARELVTAALPMEQVTGRITTAKAERDRAQARDREIRAVCQVGHVSAERTARYVRSGMSIDDVRADVTELTAIANGRTEIDGSISADAGAGAKPKPVLDRAEIYAARNR